MTHDQQPQLRFILDGFVPDRGFRLFTFQGVEMGQGVEARQGRTAFTVRTDLSLIRGYGIHVQDLPLLCRELLERRADSEPERHFTFCEEDMRLHQAGRIAAQKSAVRKKMPSRKPLTEGTGHTWRTTVPLHIKSHA